MRKLNKLFMNSIKLQAVSTFLVSLVLFSIVHQASVAMSHVNHVAVTKQYVLQRVALDLPVIPIKRDWLNEPGDSQEVQNYINSLNEAIDKHQWPLKVTFIGPEKPVADYQELSSAEQSVYISFKEKAFPLLHSLSAVPMLFALFFTWLLVFRQHLMQHHKPLEQKVTNSPLLLTIDLRSKLLINARIQKETALSNKPLCFYCALVEYCIANPGVSLNMNKDLPEEFLVLAQKYFYRLIELGHTIRKRPNFESNLDKTLSEIRAALEDVLEQDIKSKEMLIPPKAIGEGSRSKLHSFGLGEINENIVEIVGK